ncbi:hypothetical protein ARALYDRAFT_920463 [Arabidopsis lyrata subsp. lyrata]|uniref:Uncharacterized protein n=1 Tax=Arabidopsis lyrata subsp. lyrata TaxID=81972 RepID=D7MX45_ARALL|nr:hypothetical protein ARALYDRAFT_920463 [Arabidopsis lyrata subsp. lyrata]
MAKLGEASFCVLVLFLSLVSADTDNRQDNQVYVVYMGSLPSQPDYKPVG